MNASSVSCAKSASSVCPEKCKKLLHAWEKRSPQNAARLIYKILFGISANKLNIKPRAHTCLEWLPLYGGIKSTTFLKSRNLCDAHHLQINCIHAMCQFATRSFWLSSMMLCVSGDFCAFSLIRVIPSRQHGELWLPLATSCHFWAKHQIA